LICFVFSGKNNQLSSRVASDTNTQNNTSNDRNIRNKSSSTNNCSSQKSNIFSTVNSKKVNSLSHPQTLNTADSNTKKKQQLNPYYQQQSLQQQKQSSYNNDSNCVSAPSKSFSTEHMFSEQCIGSKNASFKRKHQDNNGSKSSSKSSKSNQNQQIIEGRGSFNSLLGAINYDSPSHRSHQLHQQPTNIVQNSRTYRQSSSNTPAESLDGSCTLVYSRSRVDSDSKNIFSSNKKNASGAKNNNITNNRNISNNSNNSNNNNNSLNSHNLILNSYSNNGSSDSNQLRHIIELNKQASESNSKNIEFSRQLSAPNENQTSFNSVFNLHSNNLINHQYYSGSPNTNSLNRTKKKRSFKLGGR
jgi:hypothetical protein